jgi:hypothetical protein
MADRYLLESGAPDGYLLEDGTGVLLLDVVTNLTLDIDTPGAITLAGQAMTAAYGLPLTNGAITIAGQAITSKISAALSTAGAITIAGQAITSKIGAALSTAGAITIAGQTMTMVLGTEVVISTPGSITLAGQSATSKIGVAISSPGAIVLAGQSVTLSLAFEITIQAGQVTIAGQFVEPWLVTPPPQLVRAIVPRCRRLKKVAKKPRVYRYEA